METKYEIELRLKCLILAKGNIIEAKRNYIWITTGLEPIEDRIKVC